MPQHDAPLTHYLRNPSTTTRQAATTDAARALAPQERVAWTLSPVFQRAVAAGVLPFLGSGTPRHKHWMLAADDADYRDVVPTASPGTAELLVDGLWARMTATGHGLHESTVKQLLADTTSFPATILRRHERYGAGNPTTVLTAATGTVIPRPGRLASFLAPGAGPAYPLGADTRITPGPITAFTAHPALLQQPRLLGEVTTQRVPMLAYGRYRDQAHAVALITEFSHGVATATVRVGADRHHNVTLNRATLKQDWRRLATPAWTSIYDPTYVLQWARDLGYVSASTRTLDDALVREYRRTALPELTPHRFLDLDEVGVQSLITSGGRHCLHHSEGVIGAALTETLRHCKSGSDIDRLLLAGLPASMVTALTGDTPQRRIDPVLDRPQSAAPAPAPSNQPHRQAGR